MHKQYYKDINDYIRSCGICILDNSSMKENKPIEVDQWKIYEQLKIIKEFHDRTKGFAGIMDNRIPNLTGRKIEQYKVNIKKLTRDMKRFSEEKDITSFQKLVLDVGEEYKDRAEESIRKIYESGYYEIIERSMKSLEMCAGNTYFDNLYIRQGQITMANTKRCGYNIVEYDCIYLLNKLKRKDINIDLRDIAEEFCSLEFISRNSVNFILALLDYPYEFMKCCNNYRSNRKNLNEEEYTGRLRKIVQKG